MALSFRHAILLLLLVFIGAMLVHGLFFTATTGFDDSGASLGDGAAALAGSGPASGAVAACPAGMSVVNGRIDGSTNLGQARTEANSPYTADKCRADAAETLALLQDPTNANWVASTTREEILGADGAPPKRLFYSFDANEGHCAFYMACKGIVGTADRDVVSGVVVSS